MSSESAFREAIRAAPHDDTIRLVYAEWLDEQGDPARADLAAFIRAQVELADDPAAMLWATAAYEKRHRVAWLGGEICKWCAGTGADYEEYSGHLERGRCEPCHGTGCQCWPLLAAEVDGGHDCIRAEFRRGMVGRIELTMAQLTPEVAAVIGRFHPGITEVVLSDRVPLHVVTRTELGEWWALLERKFPPEIWVMLDSLSYGPFKHYPTCKSALDALAATAAEYVRESGDPNRKENKNANSE